MARKAIKEFGVTEPPVPIDEVVAYYGLQLSKEPLAQNRSGTLRGDRITVNSNHPETRQRFTTAHELGHQLLGHHAPDEGFVDRPAGNTDEEMGEEVYVDRSDAREIEANEFASELLAPLAWLKDDIKRGRKPPELAKRYQLSGEAIWKACMKAGLLKLR